MSDPTVIKPAGSVQEELEQLKRANDAMSSGQMVSCPDCGAKTVVANGVEDPECPACGCPVFPQRSKPLKRLELYDAAKQGRSAEWVAALVGLHEVNELELLSVCEMVVALSDQGISPQVSMTYLREKLELLTAYRRSAMPSNSRGLGWDEAQKLAIPIRVGDFISIDQEIWSIKSFDKHVELKEWDRIDIEASRPYREGRSVL